ncbi:MAG: hypothetical protein OXU63_08965 [Acidobacteriota bacterium]|nr:hypothetical protein [Acidobacteriota bacterium]
MRRQSEARERAAALARRRDEVREAVADVRGALERVGVPRLAALSGRSSPGRSSPGRAGVWVLPLAAGALGITIAWSLRRLRNR